LVSLCGSFARIEEVWRRRLGIAAASETPLMVIAEDEAALIVEGKKGGESPGGGSAPRIWSRSRSK